MLHCRLGVIPPLLPRPCVPMRRHAHRQQNARNLTLYIEMQGDVGRMLIRQAATLPSGAICQQARAPRGVWFVLLLWFAISTASSCPLLKADELLRRCRIRICYNTEHNTGIESQGSDRKEGLGRLAKPVGPKASRSQPRHQDLPAPLRMPCHDTDWAMFQKLGGSTIAELAA